jgi:hypothetical protein
MNDLITGNIEEHNDLMDELSDSYEEDACHIERQLRKLDKEQLKIIEMLKNLKESDEEKYDEQLRIIIKELKKQKSKRRRRLKVFMKCCFAVKMVVGIVLIIVL